jgi:hypothetical protein
MALTKQTSTQVLSLASQVLGDRTASEEARLLAATVLAQTPLPRAKRMRSPAGADQTRQKPPPLPTRPKTADVA